METKLTAEEILNYCCNYLGVYKPLDEFKKTKLYKEMLKEICFMIEDN